MEWTVNLNGKESKLKLPQAIPSEMPFIVKINGKDKSLRWQKATKTLFFIEKNSEGQTIERPIIIRNKSFYRPTGESKTEVDIEVTEKSIAEFRATVGRYVYGQEHRDKAASSKGAIIRTPITGKVLKILVQEGDQVNAGDTIAIVEAMKMENKINTNSGGTVGKVSIEEGTAITVGTQITTIG